MKNLIFATMLFASVAANAQNYNMEFLGKKTFGQELNDIWGYTDEEGNEYALV